MSRMTVRTAVVAVAFGSALVVGSVLPIGGAGATPAQPSWPQAGYDGGGSSFNPTESTIGTANVASLAKVWRTARFGHGRVAGFVVAQGRLFVASPVKLAAYSLAACAATSGACQPEWIAHGAYGELAYSGGTIYALGTRLRAFDAAGDAHCAGTAPRVCRSLWSWRNRDETESGLSTLKIGDGRVWVRDLEFENMNLVASHLRGWDIASAPCTTARCGPTRSITTPLDADFSYALGAGTVAVASFSDALRVYAAATGVEQWQSSAADSFASPIVEKGMLYVGHGGAAPSIEAYAMNGGDACDTSTPAVCKPAFVMPYSWTNPPALAATGTRVYVNDGTAIRSYSATGTTGCVGTPRTCQPLVTFDAHSGSTFPMFQPTVANGVLYSIDDASLTAYDATGRAGCSRQTHECTALWRATPATPLPIEVTGGTVYAASNGMSITAYAPAE